MKRIILRPFEHISAIILLKINGASIGKGFQSNGVPIVDVSRGGILVIGNNFKMNNGKKYNLIGRQQPCIFVVRKGGRLRIGNNVGLSATAIVCHEKIEIGNSVIIGGNVVIYDTDFHALTPKFWRDKKTDSEHTKMREVMIGDNVFIGAHSIILKGVHIGNDSIIGAGSVVTRSIPSKEIWGGNPAKFIRKNQ